jgi:hypothetical protein
MTTTGLSAGDGFGHDGRRTRFGRGRGGQSDELRLRRRREIEDESRALAFGFGRGLHDLRRLLEVDDDAGAAGRELAVAIGFYQLRAGCRAPLLGVDAEGDFGQVDNDPGRIGGEPRLRGDRAGQVEYQPGMVRRGLDAAGHGRDGRGRFAREGEAEAAENSRRRAG